MARVNEGSHSFTCHPHVYPHMEWDILPLLPSRRASTHFGQYSFPVPRGVGGWVRLGGLVKHRGGLPVRRRSPTPTEHPPSFATNRRVSRVSCSRRLFPRFIPFAVSSWRHLQRRQRAVTTLISFDVAAFLVAVTRVIDQRSSRHHYYTGTQPSTAREWRRGGTSPNTLPLGNRLNT